MTIGLDQAPAADAAAQPVAVAAGQLPELTPEKARELAAVLAEHMMAMRAVTQGTRYAGAVWPSPLSPAMEIFLAGMLDRIRADEDADLASAVPPEAADCGACDDVAVSGLAVLAR
jgi:hypothetical protein